MDDPVIGNICPECNGGGTEVVYRSFVRDWDTGEYVDTEEIACEACDGLGYLTTPLTAHDMTAPAYPAMRTGIDFWRASDDEW